MNNLMSHHYKPGYRSFFFMFGMISIQPQPETALEKSLAPREKIRYDVGIQVAATI